MMKPSQVDPQKILIIKAKGGLGNRILSAATGLVYADLSGRVPIIDWSDGTYGPRGENAYPLLFDTPLQSDAQRFSASAAVVPAIWQGHLSKHPFEMIETNDPTRHSSPTIYRKYSVDLNRLDQPEPVAVFWCYLPKMPRIRPHLRRHPTFGSQSSDQVLGGYLKRYFTPNARVRREVDELSRTMSRPILGVHVRYTDRKVSLSKIKRAISRSRSKMPDSTLFLATDSAVVQDELTREFGKFYTVPKYLAPAGQQLHDASAPVDKIFEAENALIDMWALAACDHLIYSSNSTFSVTSALAGALTPSQLSDIDRFSLPIIVKRFLRART